MRNKMDCANRRSNQAIKRETFINDDKNHRKSFCIFYGSCHQGEFYETEHLSYSIANQFNCPIGILFAVGKMSMKLIKLLMQNIAHF